MNEIELRWLNINHEIWGDCRLPRYETERVLQYRLNPEADWQTVPEEYYQNYDR